MNNHKNIPNLAGKVAIVTGANSGTGYGITYHLAKQNCKVIIASRNKAKLEDAKAKMLKEVPNAKLELEVVDLCDLSSIKKFCERIKTKYKKIDYLANNAGGGPQRFQLTKDSLEVQLATNYLGHFAVTTQLLPVLKDGSRVVTYASIGYKRFLRNDLDIDNLMVTKAEDFNPMEEYCKGKLCSILFSVKLQDEFERIGSKSMSLACHPGYARSNLMTGDNFGFVMRLVGRIMNGVTALLGTSMNIYDGALPAIEALIADNAQPRKVYSPKKGGNMESHGDPIPREIDHTHYKDEDIDRLWVKSQKLVGINVNDYL